MNMSAQPGDLKKKLRTIALALVGGAILLIATAPEDAAESDPFDADTTLRHIETAVVTPRRLNSEVNLSGVLDADRHVQLSAESTGRIVRTHASSLDSVGKGTLLIEIDPLPAAIAVRQTEARLLRAESELALARSDSHRNESLVQRQVLSDAEMESSTNRLRVAEAMLAEARASLEQASDEQEKRQLRAPFAGVLRSFSVEEDEFVRVGQEVAELLDLTRLVLEVGLSDREVISVQAGTKVEIRVEALPARTFDGHIRRVGSAAAERSRKFPVEVEIANAEGALLPGMVARARFDLGHAAELLAIPREVTRENLGVTFVFVVGSADAEGRRQVRRRPIRSRPLPFHPSLLEVLSGLEAGETIAVSATKQLIDGELVLSAAQGPG